MRVLQKIGGRDLTQGRVRKKQVLLVRVKVGRVEVAEVRVASRQGAQEVVWYGARIGHFKGVDQVKVVPRYPPLSRALGQPQAAVFVKGGVHLLGNRGVDEAPSMQESILEPRLHWDTNQQGKPGGTRWTWRGHRRGLLADSVHNVVGEIEGREAQ